MTKNNKGRRRRRKNSGDSSTEDSNYSVDEDGNVEVSSPITGSISRSAGKKNSHGGDSHLTFAEKRELQRKAAADKRRKKMKCYLCGKSGHLRKECPGIADDGRGESKYTKSKGDGGATHLKHTRNSRKSHRKNSGDYGDVSHGADLVLPPGFENRDSVSNNNDDDSENDTRFRYLDAGIDDGETILEYLRFGRHAHGHAGHHHTSSSSSSNSSHYHHFDTTLSRDDAIKEYETAIRTTKETTNFGGCLSRFYLRDGPQGEDGGPSVPFGVFEGTSLLRFVVGFASDYDLEASEEDVLVDALVGFVNEHKPSVAGLFADLDYSVNPSIDNDDDDGRSSSRAAQQKGLSCTLRAAAVLECPIQIRIAPRYSHNKNHHHHNMHGYADAMKDLGKILLEETSVAASTTTTTTTTRIHLSCWNGKAEHLMALLKAFPQTLYVGFDGRVSFSKATHLHECAFEVPLDRVLLETGYPSSIPSSVANHLGKDAFCHSGHIPFVADAVAKHASKNRRTCLDFGDGVTAETVARCASENAVDLYGSFSETEQS